MQELGAKAYLGLAWLFVAGAVLQFFLAGAGVFRATGSPGKHLSDASQFDPHRLVGTILQLVALLMVVAVLLWQPGRDTVYLTVLLLLLMALQSVLVHADGPWLAAFHPLVGLIVTGLGFMLARRGQARVGGPAAI
jgi:hypothetical protein